MDLDRVWLNTEFLFISLPVQRETGPKQLVYMPLSITHHPALEQEPPVDEACGDHRACSRRFPR